MAGKKDLRVIATCYRKNSKDVGMELEDGRIVFMSNEKFHEAFKGGGLRNMSVRVRENDDGVITAISVYKMFPVLTKGAEEPEIRRATTEVVLWLKDAPKRNEDGTYSIEVFDGKKYVTITMLEENYKEAFGNEGLAFESSWWGARLKGMSDGQEVTTIFPKCTCEVKQDGVPEPEVPYKWKRWNEMP